MTSVVMFYFSALVKLLLLFDLHFMSTFWLHLLKEMSHSYRTQCLSISNHFAELFELYSVLLHPSESSILHYVPRHGNTVELVAWN